MLGTTSLYAIVARSYLSGERLVYMREAFCKDLQVRLDLLLFLLFLSYLAYHLLALLPQFINACRDVSLRWTANTKQLLFYATGCGTYYVLRMEIH